MRAHPRVATWYYTYLWSEPWWKLKRELYATRGTKCQDCKERPATIVHHITYARVLHEHKRDLRLLCNKCHHEAHALHDIPFLFLIYREDFERDVQPHLDANRSYPHFKYPRLRRSKENQ